MTRRGRPSWRISSSATVELRESLSSATPRWRNGASGSASQAARIAVLPERQRRFPGAILHRPRHGEMLLVAARAARPQAVAARLVVGAPEAQPVRAADARDEPAREHHEVLAAGRPIQRRAE